LDAPLVAVAWMYVFAKVWSLQYVETLLIPVLFLSVWVIYTMDHLLKAKLLGDCEHDQRLLFYKRFPKATICAVILAILTILFLSLSLQWSIVTSAMAPLVGVSLFFILSVFSEPRRRISYTKTIIAGFTFAMGCVAGLIGLSARDMPSTMISPEMVCFATLSIISVIMVDAWTTLPVSNEDTEQEVVAEWSLTLPLVALALFALLYKYKDGHPGTRPYFDVIVTCAGLLYVINRMHRNLSPHFLRVAAHLVMLFGAILYWMISA
jgi:hypothetical protein